MKQKPHDCTHLTKEERKIIQAGIENGSTKAAIARTIGKDPTTVATNNYLYCASILLFSSSAAL